MFHSIFQDRREIDQETMDPQQGLTIDHYRRFVEYYLAHGFKFVSPDDIVRGLAPDGRYALISFDDGYFNNHRMLPILEEFRIPAVFCISTRHVTEPKAFWWDILYREGRKRGQSIQEIHRQAWMLHSWKHDRIDQYLRENCAGQWPAAVSDLNRAFTSSESETFPGILMFL